MNNKITITVIGDTQRDIYHALKQITEMVGNEFISGRIKAPGFSLKFSIVETESEDIDQ